MDRKLEHIRLALKQNSKKNSFDEYSLKYYSLPLIGSKDVDLSTKIGSIDFKFPFFINAITGGNYKANKINKDFEEVAKKCEIFFFSGSFSPFLSKKINEDEIVKNMGSNLGVDKDVSKHIKTINISNSLLHQVHLNPIQEMIMNEGDKNFEEWDKNLRDILKNSPIDIIAKETGFGMSYETIKYLFDMGIKIIDISGKNGTDFSKIENDRKKIKKRYFEEIGYNTTDSLINASEFNEKIDIIASGGIRNPLDIAKSLALGAKAVGISKIFLEILEEKGKEELIKLINEWKEDLKNIFILTNSRNIKEIKGKIDYKKNF